MKKLLGVATAILLMAAVLSLSGCERVMDLISSLGLRLTSVSIEDQTVIVGENVQLQVLGLYDDGAEEAIITDLVWDTNSPGVATVTAGLVSGVAPGEAIITVTHEGRRDSFADTAIITVVPPPFIVDHFETESEKGNWYVIADLDNGASGSYERSTVRSYGESYSMEFTFNSGGAGSWGSGVMCSFDEPADILPHTGVSVWVNPNGTNSHVVLTLEDADGTQLSTVVDPGAQAVGGSSWVEVSCSFADMSITDWAPGGTPGMDFSQVTNVQVLFNSGSGTVYLDDCVIY